MEAAEFDAFYDASFSRIVGQVHAMIGHRDEAEECVQEAFVKAWSHRRTLDRDRSPEAWVRTTAYRLAVSRWRRTLRSRRAPDRALQPQHDVAPPDERRTALMAAPASSPCSATPSRPRKEPAMSDPFDALRHTPQAPSPALPAAEVRRRGDRLRRRRTIGTSLAAACTVIAVTAGAVAATGQLQGPQSSPPPATQAPEPTPTPTAVITAIPEDFPIQAGMQSPDGVDSVPAKDVSVVANLVLCGPASYSPADTATDHLGIRTLGERSVEGRDVDLYVDKGAASAAVADLVGKYQACPEFDDPDGRVALTEVSQVEALGDEAWLVSRTYEKDGAPVTGQEVVHVVRRGSAVVVAQLASDGPGATDEAALAATVEEQQDALQVLLDALAG